VYVNCGQQISQEVTESEPGMGLSSVLSCLIRECSTIVGRHHCVYQRKIQMTPNNYPHDGIVDTV